MDSKRWRHTQANDGGPPIGTDFKPCGFEQRGEIGEAIVPSDGRHPVEVEHRRPEALDRRVYVVGSRIATLAIEDGFSELLDRGNVGDLEVAFQGLSIGGVDARAPDAIRNGAGGGDPVCKTREV